MSGYLYLIIIFHIYLIIISYISHNYQDKERDWDRQTETNPNSRVIWGPSRAKLSDQNQIKGFESISFKRGAKWFTGKNQRKKKNKSVIYSIKITVILL